MLSVLVIVSLLAYSVNGIFYDSFTGTPISLEEVKKHDKLNNTFWCVNDIKPCDPNEGRRVDGSCNNMKYPTRGAPHTPFYRMLPAVYDKDYEPKKAKSGKDLPLSRYLRISLLAEGKVPSLQFTTLMTHYLLFLASDVTGFHDSVNFINWKTYCCLPKGKEDYMCTPQEIPVDDPVHRFSGIRCQNMTRPISFQSCGCINNNTTPERLHTSTPSLDLSTIYGESKEKLDYKCRIFKGGLLKYDKVQGRIWPPQVKPENDYCFANQKPFETRCHAFPDDSTPNSLLGISLNSIWFWRLHNHIATELGRINPCWSDERLFNTARDINIAFELQIFYYELLPLLMGRDNLIKDGVISAHPGFRDIYNHEKFPQLALEYPFAMRWFHTMQEGTIKMFDSNGHYMKQIPVTNLTSRIGYFAVDNNIDLITQGSFRQGSGKIDHVVDPEMAEDGLKMFQKIFDIPTSDMAKGRYFGFQGYIKYREACFGNSYKKFEDLADAIDPEYIERLKDVYDDIEDIDLLAGIWLERSIEGGHVPPTFYCIIAFQLRQNLIMDRHWYERPNRPHAFSITQLMEIRKMTIAHFLCFVGDSVKRIQPHAFLKVGPGNRIGECTELPQLDFWAWEDYECKLHPKA